MEVDTYIPDERDHERDRDRGRERERERQRESHVRFFLFRCQFAEVFSCTETFPISPTAPTAEIRFFCKCMFVYHLAPRLTCWDVRLNL